MILFQNDWLRFPGAIPDYSTKNKSFLKYVMTLQSMGIKNCLFPLALHDQTLQGVDPYDPNLTRDQKIRILIEVENNPWYYLREFARIPVAGVTGGNPVRANRGIIAQWWCLYNNLDIFMMQPRQTGKSVGADLHHVHNLYFGRRGSKMVLLTKDRKLIVKNVKKLKEIRDLLPKWSILFSKKDKDVEDFINYSVHDNQISFICAQNDSNAAINASRGHTVEKFHGDEVPFIKYVQDMIPAISAAMDDAIMEAKKNGINYGRMYTTTAGDLSLPHGKYAYDLYINSMVFTEELYDVVGYDRLQQIVKDGCGLPVPRVSLTFSHTMLGMSDEELWTRIRAVESTEENINKDYFLVWGKGGINSVIPADIIAAMDASVIQPKYVQLTETGYAIKWYIDREEIPSYMQKHQFIMGVDTSEQIGRDSTAFAIINVLDLSTVATISLKNANIVNSVNWLAQFMVTYRNILLIIEKKSTAQVFIDAVVLALHAAGENPFKRIFNQVIQNKHLKPEVYTKLKRNLPVSYDDIENGCRRLFGYNQTGNTRNFLYSKVLQESTSQARHVMKDAGLVNQLALLKTTEDGRVDHTSKEHDDMCIAWLLANWLLRYGNNLDYYGIDSKRVMVGIMNDGSKMSEKDMEEMVLINELQEAADEVIGELKRATHPGLRLRLENELNQINQVLVEYGIEPKVMDAMIKDIKQQAIGNKQSRPFVSR